MKQQPPIYGIAWLDEADVTFAHIATDDDLGAVLAKVLGHAGGSGSYPLDRDGLDRVIAAADAGDAVDILSDLADDGSDVLIVFAAGPGGADPHVAQLRDIAESGRHEVVYGEAHWWPTDEPATDPFPMIELWAKQWPDSLPIAHELKELFEDQWVRFHGLPGSKRTPESDAEWAGLIARHNTVIGELLGTGDELLVIFSDVAATPAPDDPDVTFWTSVPWHYSDPDLLFAHLYVTCEQWQRGSLDDLLRMAAEDQVAGVIIAPPELTWLYHPYAGGADVILPSTADRDAMASRHSDWRSPHPSGL